MLLMLLKYLGRTILAVLIIAIVGVLVFLHSVRLYPTEKKLTKQFVEEGYPMPLLDSVHTQHGIVNYVETGNPDADVIAFFIHGSPGSSQDFRKMFKEEDLINSFRLIAIDRLGYGQYGYGDNIVDLKDQASSFLEVVNRLNEDQKVIVIGHSYGGAPAAMMAALGNDQVHGLVLAASPMDPDHEKMFWFNGVGNSKLARFILPKSLNMASDEKMSHAYELEKVKAYWPKVTVPTVALQGDSDFLSPMENLAFIKANFTGAQYVDTISLEGQNHFFPWTGINEFITGINQVANTILTQEAK